MHYPAIKTNTNRVKLAIKTSIIASFLMPCGCTSSGTKLPLDDAERKKEIHITAEGLCPFISEIAYHSMKNRQLGMSLNEQENALKFLIEERNLSLLQEITYGAILKTKSGKSVIESAYNQQQAAPEQIETTSRSWQNTWFVLCNNQKKDNSAVK